MSKKNKDENVKQRKKSSAIADGIVLLCIFLLLDLILFGVFGAAGNVIADFFIGVFGYAIYGYSLGLTLLGILRACNLKIKQTARIILLYFAIVILTVTFAHVLSSHEYASAGWGGYIENCFNNPVTGGGALAAIFLYPFALGKVYVVSLVANGIFLFGLVIIAILLQVNVDINVERFSSRKRKGRAANGQNANVGVFDVDYTGNANAVTLINQTVDGRNLGDRLEGNRNGNLGNYVPIDRLDVGAQSEPEFGSDGFDDAQLILDTQEIAKEAGKSNLIFAKDDVSNDNEVDISQAQRDIFGVDNISGMSVINEGKQDKPVDETLNMNRSDKSNSDTSRFDILSTNERMRIIEENDKRSRARRSAPQEDVTNESGANSRFAEKLNSLLNKKKDEQSGKTDFSSSDEFSFDISDNNNYVEDKTETKPIESIDDFISNTNKDKSRQDLYDKINNYDLGNIAPKEEYRQPTDGYFNKSFEPKKPVTPQQQQPQQQTKPVINSNQEKESSNMSTSNNNDIKKEGVNEEKEIVQRSPYIPPSIDNLKDYENFDADSDDDIQEKAKIIENTYANFGISVEVKHVVVGPTVTRFEFEIPPTVSVEKIPQKKGNLMLALAVESLRIEAPIPGKPLCGVEIPNKKRRTVGLKDFIVRDEFKNYKGGLYFALGKDTDGNCFYADLTEFPHCLIAGGTGSGKSVCLNTMLISLIYKYSPEDLRIILVDPKVVEMKKFVEMPHLLTPKIYSTPKEAVSILKWLVEEMNRRYDILAKYYVNNIASYNEIIGKENKMPYILTIMDEVGDIMISDQGKEFESLVIMLTQKARACGIHLILATQRPSADVITGTIKANLPTKLAFAVTSGVNSRIILDSLGAEDLLGMGDMLYLSRKSRYMQRLQNPFLNEMEVRNIMLDLTQHNKAYYDESIINEIQKIQEPPKPESTAADKNVKEYNFPDDLCPDVLRRIISMDNVTISALQRAFTIGFPRGGKIFDWLVASGYIEKNGNKQICRLTAEQVEAIIENARNREEDGE